MPKSLTVRTDDDVYKDLEMLARETQRSKNYLANQALRQYLGTRSTDSMSPPIITSLDDLAADFWPEDDTDDFLSFLTSERQRSREAPPRDLE